MSKAITYPKTTLVYQSQNANLSVIETSPGMIKFEIVGNSVATSGGHFAATPEARLACLRTYYVSLIKEIEALGELP